MSEEKQKILEDSEGCEAKEFTFTEKDEEEIKEDVAVHVKENRW